jgi:hypothetical protein
MMLNKLSASVARWIQKHLILFLAIVLATPKILQSAWIFTGSWQVLLISAVWLSLLPHVAVLVFFVWCLRHPDVFQEKVVRFYQKQTRQSPMPDPVRVASFALAVIALMGTPLLSMLCLGSLAARGASFGGLVTAILW